MLLGTGGTIAGRADTATDAVGYRSAELDAAALLAGVPVPAGCVVQAEQVAQLDSKDMDGATWQRLVRRAADHLRRDEVAGLVVTHGTDTLEETAWLLHRTLAPGKPLVLTAAMRPATSLQADGPQNLADALTVAALPGARGVVVCVAGRVHGAADVRKRHSFRLDAFDSGDAGPLASVEQGHVRRFRDWPEAGGVPDGDRLATPAEHWPWVEVVLSHADARPDAVRAWVRAGVRGLVVAGTGNGTVHRALLGALEQAQAEGVAVRLVTRCPAGPVIAGQPHRFTIYPTLSPVQARIELMLELMAGR